MSNGSTEQLEMHGKTQHESARRCILKIGSIGYHRSASLQQSQNGCQAVSLIISNHTSTNPENLVKIGPINCEIIGIIEIIKNKEKKHQQNI